MPSFSLKSKTVRALRRNSAGSSPAGMSAVAGTGRGSLPLSIGSRWLAKDKKSALGDRFTIDIPGDAPMEAFLQEGEIGHVMVAPGVQLDSEPPKGAHYLAIGQGGARRFVSRRALVNPKAAVAPDSRPFGPPGATFVFPIFAERYTASGPFFAAVEELYKWITGHAPDYPGIPPFNEPGVKGRFGLVGHYWPTNPLLGQCNTKDIVYDCRNPPKNKTVVFHGDNDIAKAKFGHLMLGGKYGLVLINSAIRGGAGGLAPWGYPAWASTATCPGETWQGVALHEIGHALGLADEYVHPGRAHESWASEPNCAVSGNPASASWRADFTVQPPSAASVFGTDVKLTPGSPPVPSLEFVGLFKGSRYREDYYRPSFNCLMRATNCLSFCPVCRKHIRSNI